MVEADYGIHGIYGGPISWKSHRQDSVALSTSEAEYVAASEGGKEVLYIRAILLATFKKVVKI